MVLTVILIAGCSKEESNDVINDLTGTWIGNKSASATGGKRTLSVTFRNDRTGSLTYESNVYYRHAEFNYTISGNTVNCAGVIVGEDGRSNESWSQSFEYHTNYLTPIGAYSDITLYKEGYDPYHDESKSAEDVMYENALVNTTWYCPNTGSSVSFYDGHSLSFIMVSKYETVGVSGEWNISDGQLQMYPDGDASTMGMVSAEFPLISATIIKLNDRELQLINSSGRIFEYTK